MNEDETEYKVKSAGLLLIYEYKLLLFPDIKLWPLKPI